MVTTKNKKLPRKDYFNLYAFNRLKIDILKGKEFNREYLESLRNLGYSNGHYAELGISAIFNIFTEYCIREGKTPPNVYINYEKDKYRKIDFTIDGRGLQVKSKMAYQPYRKQDLVQNALIIDVDRRGVDILNKVFMFLKLMEYEVPFDDYDIAERINAEWKKYRSLMRITGYYTRG